MRSSFDKLISWTGLLLAVFLLLAGALLTWAYVFIGNEVESQLSIQGITMPEGEALESLPEEDRDALEQYAGSPLDTGPEAKAYADHYILVHMNAASDGRTYQEVSGEYQAMSDAEKASPEGQALPDCARPCSRATRCAACCSTATRSPRWAPSPASRRSARTSERSSC